MKIKNILTASTIVFLAACGNVEEKTIKTYIETRPEVIRDKWKIIDINTYDMNYYVSVSVGDDEQTLSLLHSLAKGSSDPYKNLTELELKYAEFTQKLCPDINTEEGEKVWDTLSKNLLYIATETQSGIKNFAVAKCTPTGSSPGLLDDL